MMEQLSFEVFQLITITNPFEGGFSRVTTVLEEKEITSGLIQGPVTGGEG